MQSRTNLQFADPRLWWEFLFAENCTWSLSVEPLDLPDWQH